MAPPIPMITRDHAGQPQQAAQQGDTLAIDNLKNALPHRDQRPGKGFYAPPHLTIFGTPNNREAFVDGILDAICQELITKRETIQAPAK